MRIWRLREGGMFHTNAQSMLSNNISSYNMSYFDHVKEEGQPVDPHLLFHGSGDGSQDEGDEVRINA